MFNNLSLNSTTVTRALNTIETASILQKREKEQEEILKKTQFLNKIKNGISNTINSFISSSSSSPLKNNLFKFSPRTDLSKSYNLNSNNSNSKSKTNNLSNSKSPDDKYHFDNSDSSMNVNK